MSLTLGTAVLLAIGIICATCVVGFVRAYLRDKITQEITDTVTETLGDLVNDILDSDLSDDEKVDALNLLFKQFAGDGTDWAGIIIPMAGILGLAYMAGEALKSR